MIWVGGEIVPDDALKISVLDRTFEHGLGLFETLRTWTGRAVLLDRHLARLRRSAEELGIPLNGHHLPDAEAVHSLIAADGRVGDAMIRITTSGGTTAPNSANVWMRSAPLPSDWGVIGAAPSPFGLDFAAAALNVDWKSPLGRHKTLNYWRRQLEFERQGGRESVVMADDGALVEGTRTNVFFVANGCLNTADLSYPILPGVMRSLVLERAAKLGMPINEFTFQGWAKARLTTEDRPKPQWRKADEIFLTNSVRGIVPVAHTFAWDRPAPGPWTQRLSNDILGWLNRGGIDA